MNILFFIGNGFDLNLGMKTSYKDFYSYYSKTKSKSDLISNLKKEIDLDSEKWSDLELTLGTYTAKLNSVEDFIEVFEDMGDDLAEYLKIEETNFDYSKSDIKKLYDYIAFPELSLTQADINELSRFKAKWKNDKLRVNIITFNYTRSLEKLLKYSGTRRQFATSNNTSVILNQIEHIHGYFDNRMVMGVNDVSQISNTSFHNNQDILVALLKSECNKAAKHTVDTWCKHQITQANLICIFGSSIGDTDNIWWELIGNQLIRDCKLIIFTKGEEIPLRRIYKIATVERDMKQFFLKKTVTIQVLMINISYWNKIHFYG